ncbi:MAG: PLP-dependent transferase [Chlamydiia bacterium]|nr:PLP-dependent transferase [Chlamydiia bacterium]
MKIDTHVIHAGQEPDKETGAVIPPIYMTSTFKEISPGETKGYDYTRAGNPNFDRLESALAALENGKYTTVYSSGLGALTALISTLKQNDKILLMQGSYGGTRRLLHDVFPKFGIELLETTPEKLLDHLQLQPTFLIFETPTNPLLTVHNIEKIAFEAHKNGVKVIVDNTFATPVNQTPLAHGADIVWHSTTKYLGGHSDVVGGCMITNDKELKDKLDYARMALGLNPSPFDTWLTLRGIKTLAVRMRAHNENGKKFSEFLKGHPFIKNVYYPGFSGMVSADFDLPEEAVKKLAGSFELFTLAESLGGVESLICHPASMTHASIPKEKRKEMGITDTLIRFSVGIEAIEDLIQDVSNNLGR